MSTYNTHKMPVWQMILLGTAAVTSCFVTAMVPAVWIAVVLSTIVAAIYNKADWIWYGIAASPILEVWSRMVKGAVMMDEIGKYYILLSITLLFILQARSDRYTPLYKTGSILIMLLIPSLFVNIVGFDREQWVFNILPTIEVGLLLMLVARERWDVERFARTLQFGVMPIVFIAAYLAIKTPALSSVDFMLGANFKAAGGGTNQVATVLGLGILYTMLLLLLKRPVAARWICYLLIGFLFFRSFLTFSRGGVFSAVASVFVAIGFAMIVNKKTFIRYTLIMAAFSVLGVLVFNKVDEITGHKLSQRYSGETIATITGEQEKTWNKVTSGRTTLIMADWYIFKDYPLFGVGPGAAKMLRNDFGGPVDSAAHTEFTRLISEHGIGGMLASALLLLFPFYWINKQRYRLWKGISAALFCMAILSASHSAMRTNTTIVCYVLAAVPVFINNKRAR